jgi:rare lipoprotein A
MVGTKQILTGLVVLTLGIGAGVAKTSAVPVASSADDGSGALFLLEGTSAIRPPVRKAEPEPQPAVLETHVGSASFYASSLAGRRTASGVRYNPREMVAAHRTLPFGSLLRVTNEANGRSVEVRVVDRGPFARGRVLDLSRVAAEKLDFVRHGHMQVTIEVLE